MLPSVNLLPGERRGYVDGPCGQVHYREQGAGIPIVLIHQAPWGSIQYRRAIPVLAAAGYRVVAPDLPGHGMSDPPAEAASIELYADTVAAVIAALDLGPAALVGHHGGCLVGARLAATRPELARALVTDNMPYYTAAQRAERSGTLSDVQQIKPDGSHFTDRWAVVRRIADPAWSDETVHVGIVAYFANGPWKEDGHRAAPAYDLESDIDAIACPTLVISSHQDRLFPMGRQLVERRPGWSYAEYPGGAGMVFERVREWAAPILAFLARQAS
ncbi:alpha/beta fold hydrolase [Flavisphingomonas formosensis]|uniref:alpha/beta fold hydrolase n=1 Tax=Flavisphingomonas formosensis TaxID=861534 RepID=UPI0012F79FFB|nr:alpha/beta hydrolase [Sphingomonas formosensis]